MFTASDMPVFCKTSYNRYVWEKAREKSEEKAIIFGKARPETQCDEAATKGKSKTTNPETQRKQRFFGGYCRKLQQ